MQIYFLILYFFTYGFLGWCTEIAYATVKEQRFVNRGFLNGPICPIYGVGVSVVVHFLMPFKDNLVLLYVLSTILVTVLEGLTGYILDKLFHHKWWDYTNQPLNIGGYVCLIFSLVWGVACVAIVKVIHPVIHKGLACIPYTAGLVGIILLEIALLVDLYVTAAGILKLNHQLEAMEKIAKELRELSDKLGETIHENVLETMEVTEEGKRKLDESRQKIEEVTEEGKRRLEESRQKIEEMTEESKRRFEEATEGPRQRFEDAALESRRKLEEHREELRRKYEELAEQRSGVARRLMQAFPKMESRQHKDILDELKEVLKNRR